MVLASLSANMKLTNVVGINNLHLLIEGKNTSEQVAKRLGSILT